MIVECSNCQTRFQLDESRVPARGIRVRCSRCKEAFFLQHPGATEAEAIEDVAAQAAVGAPPESTQDLPPESSVVSSSSPTEADEEEDWEFNQEPPDEDPNELSNTAFMNPDSDPFGPEPGTADEAGGDGEPEPVPGLGIDDGPTDDVNLHGGSGLDLVDEPQAAAVQDDVAFDGEEESSDFGEASDFSALGDEIEQEAASQAAAPVAAPPPVRTRAAVSVEEDVGEPEDWDFFSDESLESPAMESAEDAMTRAMAAIEADAVPRASSPGPDLSPIYAGSSPSLGGLRGAGRAVGWLATVALCAVAIARGLFHVGASDVQRSQSVDFGDVQAQEVGAVWLETARSTRLYAVNGRLVNAGAHTLVAGRGTQVALLSTRGERLEIPAARAGLPLPEEQLRELSPEALAEAAAASAEQLAWSRIEPGRGVAFQAFFDGIPDEATSFVLEMTEPARVAPPPPPAPSPEAVATEDATTTPSSDVAPGLRAAPANLP